VIIEITNDRDIIHIRMPMQDIFDPSWGNMVALKLYEIFESIGSE
jgi:hypothetical protein